MRTRTTSVAERPRDWLTIHEASALIGVSSATLRRWCDAGDVRAYTTPGGHRRFARTAVLGMLPPANRGRPTITSLGQTAESITRAYRRETRGGVAWPAAIEALAPSDRESFREVGRTIVAALADHLDAAGSSEADRLLAIAQRAAAMQGQLASRHGVGLGDTVQLFLRFRAPFLHELSSLARRKCLATTDAMDLLEVATDAFDRLMPALIAGHEAGATGGSSGEPSTEPAPG